MQGVRVIDLDSPDLLWGGALWWWASRGGDLSRCVALIRQGVPIPADRAQTFADVLEGKISPRSARGGPSPGRQLRTQHREVQIRLFFDLFLYAEQTKPGEPLKRVRTRDEAAEAVAAALSPAMTADQVLKIVNRRNRSRFKSFHELVIQKP